MMSTSLTTLSPIEILFQNENLVVVNKPEGLSSIPERDKTTPNLSTALSEKLNTKLYTVHRLDKEVSGVIIFAKNAETHRYLNNQFADREVHKTYLAVVHGAVEKNADLIDTPLRQFGSGRVAVDAVRGKSCATKYRVLEKHPVFTYLEVTPLTGRRHQIRAHFYSIGHPIVGDRLYGNHSVQSHYPRLLLHAWKISLHIAENQLVTIEADLPPSFLDILRALSGFNKMSPV